MATYTLINSYTVGAGGTASIDFTAIPSTYTDLVLRVSARGNRASVYDQLLLTLNGNTSMSTIYIQGDGTSVTSGGAGNNIAYADGSTTTGSTFSNVEVYIPNYNDSSNYKGFSVDGVNENNSTTAYAAFFAGMWSNTSAITSMSITTNSGNINQYSTAYLYGIKNS